MTKHPQPKNAHLYNNCPEQPKTEYKMTGFTREELQEIRDRAIHSAEDVPNNHWKRAYRQLADIADRLDAMEARTEDK